MSATKKLSIGQLDLRREVSRRQEDLKDKLFVEVRDKLANFMETELIWICWKSSWEPLKRLPVMRL